MFNKYFKVWKQLANCAVSSYLTNRIDSATYIVGKLVRFGFFLLFIFSIFRFTNNLAGYSKYEVVLFFLTFNLVDQLAQAFFRGVYFLSDDVQKGNFDYVISKPVNPLFYTLSRMTDILDIAFLVPIMLLIVYTGWKLGVIFSFAKIFFYLSFVILGLLMALGIHILSCAITIATTKSENFIWFYRELITVGRFPPEIFSPAVQFIFTFILPIIIIVAFPAKAFLGILDWRWMIFAFFYAILFFAGSIILWKNSLKRYSSASS